MPTSSLLDLVPIPEEDIVEAPTVTIDAENMVDEVLQTRTPAKGRRRSDSITNNNDTNNDGDDDSSVTTEYSVGGTPLRRSTRKRRPSIRSMEAEPVKTPSPKKKLTTKSSSSKRKAKTPASEKKTINTSKITTPVRRSSRIRRN